MEENIKNAVKQFWNVRDGGSGVLGGKTLDGFIELMTSIIIESGLDDAQVHTGKTTSQLPGYFRPHKSWDVVVTSRGNLVAAIELKSQVGSIGNNFNNRSEEVLGSGIDLHSAIQEEAFGNDAEVFTGYLILVEDSPDSQKKPLIGMKYFPVMHGFLSDESARSTDYVPNANGEYPRLEGVSYLERYDIMCKKLVLKNLYTAASLIVASSNNSGTGDYRSISPQTGIESFFMKLESHCKLVASHQQFSN
jgi:hypothetical protein